MPEEDGVSGGGGVRARAGSGARRGCGEDGEGQAAESDAVHAWSAAADDPVGGWL